jgi:hypothetical protein
MPSFIASVRARTRARRRVVGIVSESSPLLRRHRDSPPPVRLDPNIDRDDVNQDARVVEGNLSFGVVNIPLARREEPGGPC